MQPTHAHASTRASHRSKCLLTHNELVKLYQDSITSATQAQDNLEKQGYAQPDTKGSKAALSYTLHLLAHCAPLAILPKAIRAVAIILECEEATNAANTILATVMHRLNPMLNLMDHLAEITQAAVEDMRKGADCLYRTGEETPDELQKGIESAKEDQQKLSEDVKDGVSKLTELAAMAASTGGNAPMCYQEMVVHPHHLCSGHK